MQLALIILIKAILLFIVILFLPIVAIFVTLVFLAVVIENLFFDKDSNRSFWD